MKRLKDLVQSVFDENYDLVASVSDFRDLDWNSLQHMQLILAIEREFAIKLDPEEIMKLTSVEAIRKVLISKGLEL